MSEEIENEEQPQVNFYRLDKTKPYKTVSAAATSRAYIFLIIFAVVFLVSDAVFTAVYSLSGDAAIDVTAIIAPVFLAAIGFFFLGLGIYFHKRRKRLTGEESELLSNCTLTDGRITEYRCVESSHTDGSHTTYFVELEYVFFDRDLTARSGKYSATYGYEPQFYKGQYLMIAFNATDSLILSEFTLEKEDEKRFLQVESGRSDDDFDDITGELIDVDLKKRVKDYHYSIVWFWAAFAVFVFSLAYTVPISIFVVPHYFDFKWIVPDVIALVGIYLMPVILLGVSAFLLKKYFVASSHFKKIMSGRPYFTLGKVFASEKTYHSGARKKVFYCYIDKWGERHTEVVTSYIYLARIQGEDSPVLVAYTSAGDSTIITECILCEQENL